MRHALIALALVACGASPDVDAGPAQDAGADGPSGPWRSALFPADWAPGTRDAEGRALHDFSYAGYRLGDDVLGRARIATRYDVVAAGADPGGVADSTAAIQSAIDAAEGAGGEVFFPAGLYRIDGQLTVAASRVVLAGEGPERSRLYFPRVEGLSYAAHVLVGAEITSDLEVALIEDAAARATSVRVEDASGLAVGDAVEIGHVVTAEFVADHGMTGVWTAFNDTWQTFARRTITGIVGDRVELDVPLRAGARVRDGASLRRVHGELAEVGVEALGIADAVSPDAAWAESQVRVLELRHVVDAWVRDVRSFPSPAAPSSGEGAGDHLASGGILVSASRRVTIADVHLERAQHRGGGGNGYLFEIRSSNEILTRDSTGRAGRHDFIQNWGFGTSGCVWLRVRSSEGRAYGSRGGVALVGPSEFHHSLATANLIDASELEDGWAAVNRGTESTGAGHSASENVFWNTRGAGTLRSMQWGWGYVIGTGPELEVITEGLPWEAAGTAPVDLVEGLGRAAELEPPSLYEAQRALRLGR